MTSPADRCDPQLAACLSARTPEDVEASLRDVVMGTVLPVTRRIVRAAMPGGFPFRCIGHRRSSQDDIEDIVADTVLRVLTRIQLLREGAEVMPITDLIAFIGASARNAVASMHRQQTPGRTLVAKRLDYHLGNMPDVEVRHGADGTRTVRLRDDAITEQRSSNAGPHTQNRIREHLRLAGGTLEHDELVRLVASEGSMPLGAVLLADLATGKEAKPDADPGMVDVAPDQDLLAHEELRILWSEIVALPLHQRRALLLGLEDIALLPISGTASLRHIAAAMEMPPDRLAACWQDLPMSDAAIAATLGTTDVRVRNFRKCARERLGRRMAASGLGRPSSQVGGER